MSFICGAMEREKFRPAQARTDVAPDDRCVGCGNIVGKRCRYWQTPKTKLIWPCTLRQESYLKEKS